MCRALLLLMVYFIYKTLLKRVHMWVLSNVYLFIKFNVTVCPMTAAEVLMSTEKFNFSINYIQKLYIVNVSYYFIIPGNSLTVNFKELSFLFQRLGIPHTLAAVVTADFISVYLGCGTHIWVMKKIFSSLA